MALRDLVEPECGASNPLMKVTSHYTQDRARHEEQLQRQRLGQEGLVKPLSQASEDELVQEYFAHQYAQIHAAPQTFQMASLLREMQEIDSLNQPTVQGPGIAHLANDVRWANEFLAGGDMTSTVEASGDARWSQEYADQEGSTLITPGAMNELIWAEEYLDGKSDANAADAVDSERWAQDFAEQDSLAAVARSLTAQVTDPKLMDTKFMSYIRQLGQMSTDSMSTDETAKAWSEEFASTAAKSANGESWASEYEQLAEGGGQGDFWDRLQKEWEQMSKDDTSGEHPWLSDYETVSDPFKDYKMTEDNPLLDQPDPFNEGLQKLKDGDLPSAVLLFEAAVQKSPDNAEAWQYLGTSQAENENDAMAIAALKKCLQIQPDNLTALMALAVSYTNESLQVQACHTLQMWLNQNPKYSPLVSTLIEAPPPGVMSLMSSTLHTQVCDQYIAAARQSPDDVDADVQCGLGVLFNLSGDYDKAIDCFSAAVRAKPQDSLLWNKLGATLANAKRSEEAITAYHEALKLSPGFIRSRYNLGISCINLKAYQQAAEHFLTALNMQATGRGISGSNSSAMSDTIWSTVRLLISLLERADLFDAVDSRDLERLNSELGGSS